MVRRLLNNGLEILWKETAVTYCGRHHTLHLAWRKQQISLMKVSVMVEIRTRYLFLQLESIFSVKQTYNPQPHYSADVKLTNKQKIKETSLPMEHGKLK